MRQRGMPVAIDTSSGQRCHISHYDSGHRGLIKLLPDDPGANFHQLLLDKVCNHHRSAVNVF